MRREDRFLISRRPYAVDLSSLGIRSFTRTDGTTLYQGHVRAVWYRGTKTAPVACLGNLNDYQTPAPGDPVEFMERYTDSRWGGNCEGRWDGTRYWGAQEPEVMEQHLEMLRPMITQFPTIPDGFDGWWTFHQPRKG